jgi:hypothetical protein
LQTFVFVDYFKGAIVIPTVLLCIVAIGALPYLHLQYRKNYDAVKAKVMGFLDKL